MIESFINQTISVLQKSNVRFHEPEVRKITFNYDEKTRILITGYSEVFFNKSDLSDNPLAQLLLFFGVFDAHIDIKHPEFEDKRFEQKYSLLPENNDEDIVVKQVYRILTLLRNIAVHNKSTLSINDEIISCKKGEKELQISREGLELTYTVICMLVNPRSSNAEYYLGLLRQYYDDINGNIIVLKDKYGEKLPELSNGIRLKRHVRIQIENPLYELGEAYLKITPPDISMQYWEGLDYYIDGGEFIIPEEALDTEDKLLISDLHLWKKIN